MNPLSSIRKTLDRVRVAELTVFAVALGLNLWSLSIQGFGNTYYAAAVRSMTASWSNFFFAAFDPGGWSTVDKPPLAWWAPALSAKVFGFSSWSILWPSAVAGAAAVLLLCVTVRRVWGPLAGLIAGGALATMPVAVAVSRSNNPDVWLVLGVVAAAWALERAVATGRLRWAAAMGALIGVAFLTKLSAALIVAPGLWFAYLVASRTSWRRRVAGLAVATGGFVGLALAWVGTVALVPRSARPWVGGSTDGTAWNLVVGYNGLGRITGSDSHTGGGGNAALQLPGSKVNSFGGEPGLLRLFNNGMGDQVMWLFVVAAVGGLAATWLLLRRHLTHGEAASLVGWGGWAATTFVAFSFASGVLHNYYVSLLAPALAALVGIGAAVLVRGGRTAALVAVAALAGTAALQLVFLGRIDELTALRVVTPVLILAAATGLAVHAVRQCSERVGRVLVAASAATVLLAPAAWSVSSLGHAATGAFPEARPVTLELDLSAFQNQGMNPEEAFVGATRFTRAELEWLRKRRLTEDWLVAVDGSASEASDAIVAGYSVLAIGGFRGVDPTMDNAALADLVRSGRLRFVSVAPADDGPGPDSPQDPTGSVPSSGQGMESTRSIVSVTATAVCGHVPANAWGGAGDSTLYDCADRADAIAAARETPPTTSPSPGDSPAPSPTVSDGG